MLYHVAYISFTYAPCASQQDTYGICNCTILSLYRSQYNNYSSLFATKHMLCTHRNLPGSSQHSTWQDVSLVTKMHKCAQYVRLMFRKVYLIIYCEQSNVFILDTFCTYI